MSKLRDNQALCREVEAIAAQYDSMSAGPLILDAVDRHLAQPSAHPGHLQGEAPASPWCDCPMGKCHSGAQWNKVCRISARIPKDRAPASAPTPTTTIIEPTPGPSHRPGGPPSPPPEPAQVGLCCGGAVAQTGPGGAVFLYVCAIHGTGRPASPGGSSGGAAGGERP